MSRDGTNHLYAVARSAKTVEDNAVENRESITRKGVTKISYCIKIKKDVLLELELCGDLHTITAEVLASLVVVYQKLKQNSRLAAEEFKNDVERAIKSGIVFEDEDTVSKVAKKYSDKLAEELFKKLESDGDDEK